MMIMALPAWQSYFSIAAIGSLYVEDGFAPVRPYQHIESRGTLQQAATD